MQLSEDWSSFEKEVIEYAKVFLSASQLAEQRKMGATLGAMRHELGAIRGDVSGMRHDISAVRDDVAEIRQDIAGVRQDVQAQLEIQQEVVNRQAVQDKLEEFIYQMQKMIGDFRQPHSDYPPVYQFLFLNKLFETIAAEGITTPMIRGRDNKAAFDKCIDDGRDLQRSLRKNPDVRTFLQDEKHRGQVEKKVQELEKALQRAGKLYVLTARPGMAAIIGGGGLLPKN